MQILGINPEMLIWAREKAGYSINDVAQKMKKDISFIKDWESGTESPTYAQLERLAYVLYKRPIALFFFPEPPDEVDLQRAFRTLPDFEINNLIPDTRYAVRQAMAMQISLRELNDGINKSEIKIFNELKINLDRNPVSEASRVSSFLGVRLDDRQKWTTVKDALEGWREIIQNNGIFIFKRSFKQEDVSGLSLLDNEFPIIYLNNSTSATRQIFTIFHELSHLLLKTNGMTKEDHGYISSLTGNNRKVEVFCNQFAAELLVPSKDFEGDLRHKLPIDQLIPMLSNRYKVSREVILRKLLDKKIIDQSHYENQVKEWLDDYKARQAKKQGGGNYYYTQMTYLGDRYLKLAFSNYYQGRCSTEQLADYLNIKAKNVTELEHFMHNKASI